MMVVMETSFIIRDLLFSLFIFFPIKVDFFHLELT